MAYCSQCGRELQNGVCVNETCTASRGETRVSLAKDSGQQVSVQQTPEQQAFGQQTPLQQNAFAQDVSPSQNGFGPASSPPPKKGKKGKVVLIVLLVLFLGFVGLLLLWGLGIFLFFFLRDDTVEEAKPELSYATSVVAPAAEQEEPPAANEASSEVQVPLANEETLLAMLQESDYAMWHITMMPNDAAARSAMLSGNNWNLNCGAVSMAMWAEGAHTMQERDDLHSVSQESLQAVGSSFYRIENINISEEAFLTGNGEYIIPAHGPMHTAELLVNTVMVEDHLISVQTQVTYFDDYGEDANRYQVTLKHTFAANEPGAYVPFQLVETEELESSLPLYNEGIVPPSNLLDPTVLAEVDVLELNLREGPGTDYDVIVILEEGMVLEVIGTDDTGEWACTPSGWVSIEYIRAIDA